jgi:hypothetical protein
MSQSRRRLSRRQALHLAAGVVAFIHGKVVTAQVAQVAQVPNVSQYAQMRAPSRQTLLVALDGIDEIAFQYRGQRESMTPAELLSALGGK